MSEEVLASLRRGMDALRDYHLVPEQYIVSPREYERLANLWPYLAGREGPPWPPQSFIEAATWGACRPPTEESRDE